MPRLVYPKLFTGTVFSVPNTCMIKGRYFIIPKIRYGTNLYGMVRVKVHLLGIPACNKTMDHFPVTS